MKQNRTTEGQSSGIEQTEDRISELEDEMVIKGKIEEQLIKQLKTYEKKMQELTNSIKRPNLNHGDRRSRRGASEGNT
jgi:polyhydroxyalkanoate synthesis regulator phasin